MQLMKLWRRGYPYLPAGIWYILIFSFSAQTGPNSSALSDRLAYWLLELVWPDFFLQTEAECAAILNTITFCLRKAAHMALYFILAALLLWAVRKWPDPQRLAAYVVLLCAVLASLDEFHQTFVPGRSGQFRDVLIDLAGVGFFLLLRTVYLKVARRTSP